MIYRIEGIRLDLESDEHQLKRKAAEMLGVDDELIVAWRIIRKAIDARKNRPPVFVYILDIATAAPVLLPLEPIQGIAIKKGEEDPYGAPACLPVRKMRQPVVVGCGPAGLFAALTFVLHGLPVLLIERGKAIKERVLDVDAFWRLGLLDADSNVQFGEGGAGTFSDGKLTSRAKNPLTGWIKKTLVDMGAPVNILTDGKPHIGTDRLRHVMINLRKYLMARGCEVRFGSRMTDILIREQKVVGVVVNGAMEIASDCLILACGQSADDTYALLRERGVHLEPKPFAVGLRVEHPQDLINTIQYGRWANHPKLPPAEYFMTARVKNDSRSVYTFCMCPGGRIIGSSTRVGGVITNGMSDSRRDGYFANSAVVVNIRTDDFAVKSPSVLSGLAFRRQWEARAFLLGGAHYGAPAERLRHFLEDRTSPEVGQTSFMPAVLPAPLRDALPLFVTEALKEGLVAFDRKMPGFISQDANLIGVETRTSSPVRITRGSDGQSISVAGLYPCGEGAGYAGGIISSAIDGILAAQRALML